MGTRLGTVLGTQLGTVLGTDLGGSAGAPSPSIVGTPWIGDTLSILNAPGGATYQWTRDGVDIGGATSATYVVVAADIGPEIACKVNGTPTAAAQYYFGDFATRLGIAQAVKYCLDFRDLANGAVTGATSRITGAVFTVNGSGISRDTSVGGKPTLVLTGAGGLRKTATELGGAFGVSVMYCPIKVGAAGTGILASTGYYGSAAGAFELEHIMGTNRMYFGTNYGAGGPSKQSAYFVTDTLASPAVWYAASDSRNWHPEADFFYKNGTKQVATSQGYTGNAIPGTDTLDGTKTFTIGEQENGTNRANCKLVGAFVVYNRELMPVERVHEQLVMAYLVGVTSASIDTTVPAFAGYAWLCAGQSNSTGYDNVSYPGTQPVPWPDADVSPYLWCLTGSQTTSPTRIALAEPVNGLGGTHYVSFLSSICRAAGYGGTTIEQLCIPGPPVNGTAIASWQKGNASAQWGGMIQKAWWALKNGYEIQGLVWYQGESDAINVGDYPVFASLTSQMLADLVTYTLSPSLRVLLHRIHATQPGGFPYWTNIRSEVDNVSFANRIVVNASGALMADNLHLTTDAQRAQGYTDATAYLAQWPVAS